MLPSNGGTSAAKTKGEGLNAGTFRYLHGGQTYAYNSANNGSDLNGKLTMMGGVLVAPAETGAEEGFAGDNNTLKIMGGTLGPGDQQLAYGQRHDAAGGYPRSGLGQCPRPRPV